MTYNVFGGTLNHAQSVMPVVVGYCQLASPHFQHKGGYRDWVLSKCFNNLFISHRL